MRQIRTNEATRYELVATNGERTILIGYTARNNRTGALALLRDGYRDWTRSELLAKATATKIEDWYTERGVIAGNDNGNWVVKFSGRTQRTAATEGELEDTIYTED